VLATPIQDFIRRNLMTTSPRQPQSRRDVLPVPDVIHIDLTTYDAKDPDTHYPPIRDIRPPNGAPNVLVILLDDVGYGASSAFGGPCHTPNFEKLAAGGLKYTRFHTTALCSPTRQALLTGRNHHSVGMGCITEAANTAGRVQRDGQLQRHGRHRDTRVPVVQAW
jgi:Sulfatase